MNTLQGEKMKHWRDTLFPEQGATLYIWHEVVYAIFGDVQIDIYPLPSMLRMPDETVIGLLQKAREQIKKG